MALVTCPDCGKEISDAAPACPGCGRPMVATTVRPSIWYDRNFGCGGCALVILVIALVLFFKVCAR